MADMEALGQHLAANLRHQREHRGLTQAALARLCEVPRSTIANLETGAGNPTLSVLAQLASALQLSIEELLSPPRGLGRVYPKGSLPIRKTRSQKPAQVHKLLPDPIPGMEIDRLALSAGARIRGVPHRPGTREYLYCETGSVVLRAGGERFDLEAGDVCAFRGDLAHSYANESRGPCVLFSVVTLAPLRGE